MRYINAITNILFIALLASCDYEETVAELEVNHSSKMVILKARLDGKDYVKISKHTNGIVQLCDSIRLRNTTEPMFLINANDEQVTIWHSDYTGIIDNFECYTLVQRVPYNELVNLMKEFETLAGESYRFCNHCTEGFDSKINEYSSN